jgi:hypothetical protein
MFHIKPFSEVLCEILWNVSYFSSRMRTLLFPVTCLLNSFCVMAEIRRLCCFGVWHEDDP